MSCFVCSNSDGLTRYNLLANSTNVNNTLLNEKLLGISRECDIPIRVIVECDVLCSKCFRLLNLLEKLENQINGVKAQLVGDLQKHAIIDLRSEDILEVTILKLKEDDDPELDDLQNENDDSDDSDVPLIKQVQKRPEIECRTRKSPIRSKRCKRKTDLVCLSCNKTFCNGSVLNRHMRKFHLKHEGELRCKFCTEVFTSSRDVDSHVSRVHGKKNTCRQCEQEFTTEVQRKVHEMEVHKIHHQLKQCDKCGKYFGGKSALTVHIRRHHTKERPFHCNYPNCRFSSSTRNDLKVHTVFHTRNFPFSCQDCKKGFATLSKLNYHSKKCGNKDESVADHSKLDRDLILACSYPLCTYQSSNKDDVVIHRRIHDENSPYKCTSCSFVTTNEQALSAHVITVHPVENVECELLDSTVNLEDGLICTEEGTHQTKDENTVPEPDSSSQDNSTAQKGTQEEDPEHDIIVYPCQSCHLVFVNTSKLLQHESLAHNIEHPLLKCQECDREFLQSSALRSHVLRKHSQRYFVCCEDNCEFKTTDAYDLKRHMCTHTGIFPFECLICNKGFTNRKKIQVHRLYVHKLQTDNSSEIRYNAGVLRNPPDLKRMRRLKTFTCETCGEQISGYQAYSNHFKTSSCVKPNNKGKNYRGGGQCDECGKVFLTSQNLDAHLLDHKGVVKFKCTYPECKKGYNVRSALTAHVKFAHQRIKRLFCELCGEGFRYMASLRSHQATRHGQILSGKSHTCSHCGKVFPTTSRMMLHISRNHTKHKNFPCREESNKQTYPTCREESNKQTFPFREEEKQKSLGCRGEENTYQFNYVNETQKDHEAPPVDGHVYTYACNICNRDFTNKQKFNVHMIQTHNIKILGDQEVVTEVIIDPNNTENCMIPEVDHGAMIVQSEEVLQIS